MPVDRLADIGNICNMAVSVTGLHAGLALCMQQSSRMQHDARKEVVNARITSQALQSLLKSRVCCGCERG
jgi:hypothetical protein